jgi:hypothetical protein
LKLCPSYKQKQEKIVDIKEFVNATSCHEIEGSMYTTMRFSQYNTRSYTYPVNT